MPSPLLERMRTLCALPGPPGREGAVRDELVEMLGPEAELLREDAFGNLVAQRGSREGGGHLLIECHMDEVGLVVQEVEEGGAIRFEKVGAVADGVLPAREVDLLAEDGSLHRGVINARSGHIQALHGQEHPIAAEMWIDLGTDGQGVRALGLGPGAPAVFDGPFQALAGGAWKTKALDNRSGCALCVEAFLAAKGLGDRLTLTVAFCVQEEVGARGASVLSVETTCGGHPPDAAVVLDNVHSEGPEGVRDARGARLGGGPVLRRYDYSPRNGYGHIAPMGLVGFVRQAARDAQVPLQEDVFVGTYLDTATLSRSRPGGFPSVGINLPRRYSHSPAEVFLESDLEAMAALLGTLIRNTAEGKLPPAGKDYSKSS